MIVFFFKKFSRLNLYFLSLICIFSLAIGCSKVKSNNKGIVTFVSGKVFLNGKKAKTGDSLHKNATIKTEKKSMAVIQFQKHSLITLRENTTVQIAELLFHIKKKSDIQLKQKIGTTFSQILRNKTNFKITTPTVVAGVRGTAFSITCRSNLSTIRILRGKVSLRKTDSSIKKGKEKPSAKEIIISAGEKIEISDNISDNMEDSKQSLSPKETENLELMNKVALLDDIEKKENVIGKSKQVIPASLETQIIKKLDIDKIRLEKKEQKGIKKNNKKTLTLAELEQKYGTLSVIITKGGKRITGSFQKKGSDMEIMTVKGKVILPMAQVKKVQPLKQ